MTTPMNRTQTSPAQNSSANISPTIFRAYDIRGIAEQDLNTDAMYWIGRAVATEVLAQGFETLHLAWDGRLSSPALAAALEQGLLASGVNVNSLGAQPTGLLYFATHVGDTPCGVMVTGSHNPAQYNGVKIVINQQALSGEQIQALYQRIVTQDLASTDAQGTLTQQDLSTAYVQSIVESTQIARRMKVVVDAGNGIGGPLAKRIMATLNVDATCLYCDVDGHFPNHHPDPGVPANLVALQQTVREQQADLGLALDGDADRIALVDNQGTIIWPDKLLMFLLQEALPHHPGATALYDVKSSGYIPTLVELLGGTAIMAPTGHSIMKRKMQEHHALYGGEFSGHLYINDGWYGFDDGLFAGVKLMSLLSQQEQSSAAVFAQIPVEISTPEITLDVDEKEKFAIIDRLAGDTDFLEGAQIQRVDGLRLEYADGWCLIRASNTTAKLTLRFAAQSEDMLAYLQQHVRIALTQNAPSLSLAELDAVESV